MSQLLESSDQSIGASALASVLPMNIQDWFPSGFTSLSKTPTDFAVQEALKSLLQHYSSKASIHQCPAFFMVQLSYPYMITGETIVLTIWTFVSKVMSLLFNMMSRFVIDFPAKSECLLISWLQSPPAVIFEPKKIKSLTISTLSSSICLEVMELLLYHIRE